MDFFANQIHGFSIALSPWNLLYAFVGALLGTAIGVLPGLGPATTIALLLPVTYTMDATSAIILLAGVYYGAMYGGSTTSILLNIPGEAASVVTCLDGYQMARKGRAGPALGISAMGSFIAGTISVLLMSMVAPALASFALKFGPAEYSCSGFLRAADGGVPVGGVDSEGASDDDDGAPVGDGGDRPGPRGGTLHLRDSPVDGRDQFYPGGDGPLRRL